MSLSRRRRREKTIIFRDNRERRWSSRMAVRSVSSSRRPLSSIADIRHLARHVRISRHSDAGTDTFHESDYTFDALSDSGSYENLSSDIPNYNFMPSPNTDSELEPTVRRKKHSIRSLAAKSRSRSLFSLVSLQDPTNLEIVNFYH